MLWPSNRVTIGVERELRDGEACRTGPSEGGFTLVELLVAASIALVLITLLYQVFGATLRTTEIVDQEAEIFRIAQIGFSIMGDELRSTYWSKDLPYTFFSGTKDSLRYTSLSRHRYGEGVEGSDLATLYYFLETDSFDPGESLTYRLMHEEETNVLSFSSKSLQRSEIGEGVETFELSYFGDRSWVDSWDTSVQGKLPEAVEIRLTYRGQGGKLFPFLTRIAIPISSEES
jgi:general secretion pathway protein J